MNIFLTVNKNWNVNKKQEFELKSNKDYFVNLTKEKIIVYDESFMTKEKNKDILKNKISFCFLPKEFEDGENIVSDFKTLFEKLSFYNPSNVFVVASADLEEQLLPYCQKAYITKIETNDETETTFPNLDKKLEWELVKTSDPTFEDGIVYYFCEYVNKKPLKFNYGYEEDDLI